MTVKQNQRLSRNYTIRPEIFTFALFAALTAIKKREATAICAVNDDYIFYVR